MRLFRAFPWNGKSLDAEEGGPFHVPRRIQGLGRHDCPERYGALYCSTQSVSALAEIIQPFRGTRLEDSDFIRPGGQAMALAQFDLDELSRLLDLDEPKNLSARGLRPSRVACGDRAITRAIAEKLFEEDFPGFFWWSALEAQWINATLFDGRVAGSLRLLEEPIPLSVSHPEVRLAAERLGVHI